MDVSAPTPIAAPALAPAMRIAAPPTLAADIAGETMPAPVRLTRIDASRNMRRFYSVAVEVTLFDDVACTRTYGRIGGRVILGLFETQDEGIAALGRIVKAKLARGYRRES